MSGGAWCHSGHNRTGLVSNQSRYDEWDKTRSGISVAVCANEKCIAKAIKYVAGSTNETATYEPDEVTA